MLLNKVEKTAPLTAKVLEISKNDVQSIRNAFLYKSSLNPYAPPIINNKLIESCKIYHMPNNYVNNNNTKFASITFNECINQNKLHS